MTQPQTATVPAGTEYLTARQAAAYINVPYTTFRKIATQIKRCRFKRFRKADLDKFMATAPRT